MSDQDDVQTAMADAHDAQKSLDQMKIFMELRGLQPNTVYTFALCGRRFLAHAGKVPAAIKTADVESFLLDLTRKGRSPPRRLGLGKSCNRGDDRATCPLCIRE